MKKLLITFALCAPAANIVAGDTQAQFGILEACNDLAQHSEYRLIEKNLQDTFSNIPVHTQAPNPENTTTSDTVLSLTDAANNLANLLDFYNHGDLARLVRKNILGTPGTSS